jgi:hypothetical protein
MPDSPQAGGASPHAIDRDRRSAHPTAACTRRRFAYAAHPKLLSTIRGADSGRFREVMAQEDAFGTIMQWLYGRIDAVRAQRAGAQAPAAAAGVQGQEVAAA